MVHQLKQYLGTDQMAPPISDASSLKQAHMASVKPQGFQYEFIRRDSGENLVKVMSNDGQLKGYLVSFPDI